MHIYILLRKSIYDWKSSFCSLLKITCYKVRAIPKTIKKVKKHSNLENASKGF